MPKLKIARKFVPYSKTHYPYGYSLHDAQQELSSDLEVKKSLQRRLKDINQEIKRLQQEIKDGGYWT